MHQALGMEIPSFSQFRLMVEEIYGCFHLISSFCVYFEADSENVRRWLAHGERSILYS